MKRIWRISEIIAADRRQHAIQMREIDELLPSFSGGFAILMRARSPDLPGIGRRLCGAFHLA
jgi:hypothetical protein